MAGRVVGAGWAEMAMSNEWTPTASVASPHNAIVEVWWMSQTVKGRYNPTAQEWIGLDGIVMVGVTHWRMIRE